MSGGPRKRAFRAAPDRSRRQRHPRPRLCGRPARQALEIRPRRCHLRWLESRLRRAPPVRRDRPGLAAARPADPTAPVWKAHPDGGLMLAFGTGRELTVADRTDRQVQTVYGVRDDAAVSGVDHGPGPDRNGPRPVRWLSASAPTRAAVRALGVVQSGRLPRQPAAQRRAWICRSRASACCSIQAGSRAT